MTTALTVVAASALAGCGGTVGRPAPAAQRSAVAQPQSARTGQPGGQPGRVPDATTHTTVRGAPRDRASGAHDGTVARPRLPADVHDAPGGRVIARLPVTQLGGPTWVPVVERDEGWLRVLLPSRPGGSTGWLAADDVVTARTPYAVRVDTSRRTLTLTREGRRVGTWRVATGAPGTPTPHGRTFVLAQLTPSDPGPSPLVIPLGTHSATLDTFGGGPGTVALHGWPDASVFGRAVSHGCVRVPAVALRQLSGVPLGTVVQITG